jgi:hypothetical protein
VPPATPLCHNMQAAAGRNRCVTKTTPSPIDGSISLDDFSNFQYMLARPFVAKAIVNQITSFVFYNEPYNERKAELDHHVLCRGRITLINYYCCCLAVLPSHLLGMSRWISAVDEAKNASNIQSGETMRRFRYSYYCGWLQVDTYHVCVGTADAGNGKDQRFRLVEYMDCPLSPSLIFHAVLALVASFVVYGLRSCSICIEASFAPLVASVLVLFRLILLLTGVHMS